MLAALLLIPGLVTHVANINIRGSTFKPDSVRIEVGDTVRWTQMDGTQHTAAATPYGGDGYWISGVLTLQNPIYERVFTAPGTYTYDCSIHAFMKGKIIVIGDPVAVAASAPEAPLPQGREERMSLRDAKGRRLEAPQNGRKAPAPAFKTPRDKTNRD
jgi:plastocyanin